MSVSAVQGWPCFNATDVHWDSHDQRRPWKVKLGLHFHAEKSGQVGTDHKRCYVDCVRHGHGGGGVGSPQQQARCRNSDDFFFEEITLTILVGHRQPSFGCSADHDANDN